MASCYVEFAAPESKVRASVRASGSLWRFGGKLIMPGVFKSKQGVQAQVVKGFGSIH